MDPDALFEIPDVARVEPEPKVPMNAGQRLRARQDANLASGLHPLSRSDRAPIRLHTDAAPRDDRDAPGLRCGGCKFREQRKGYDATHSFAKCVVPDAYGRPSRVAHSAASDVAAWWPACRDYEAKPDERGTSGGQ